MSTLDNKVASGKIPLVSVIMPHWQALLYIKEAMLSIAHQTFLRNGGNLELIIIDDGSVESEYSLLEEVFHSTTYNWEKPFTRVLDTVPHGGKNRAIEYAKKYMDPQSRYTFVADADDVFAPEFVQTLFDALDDARAKNPNVVMAYCDSILIDSFGLCVGTATAPDFNRTLYFGEDEKGGSNFIPGNALVVTKRFLSARPKDLDAIDRDKLWRHMAELGEVGTAVHVTSRDYFYRQHDGQMSGHARQLEQDSRYGEKGFFARWPADVMKFNWRQWLALPQAKQQELLLMIPNTDTKAWEHYL